MKILTLLYDFSSGYTPLTVATTSSIPDVASTVGCYVSDSSIGGSCGSNTLYRLWPVVNTTDKDAASKHRSILNSFIDEVLKLPEDDGLRMHLAVVKHTDNGYDFSDYYNARTFVVVVTDELYTAISLYLATELLNNSMTITEYLASAGFKPGMERMPSAIQLQSTARAYTEMSELIWTNMSGPI